MGCDIHLFAEAKIRRTLIQKIKFWKKPTWQSIETWRMNYGYEPPRLSVPYENRFYSGGRNYNLFCALCGVRNYQFTNDPPIISNPKGIPEDVSKEVLNEIEVWDSDGHSHSFNTLKELKSFDWSPYGDTCDRFLKEVLSKMHAVGVDDEDVRIVYFFDN